MQFTTFCLKVKPMMTMLQVSALNSVMSEPELEPHYNSQMALWPTEMKVMDYLEHLTPTNYVMFRVTIILITHLDFISHTHIHRCIYIPNVPQMQRIAQNRVFSWNNKPCYCVCLFGSWFLFCFLVCSSFLPLSVCSSPDCLCFLLCLCKMFWICLPIKIKHFYLHLKPSLPSHIILC